MLLAHALLKRLVEVLGEEGGATVEEGCKRCYESADEADGHDTLDTGRQNVLNHDGEGGICLLHLDRTLLCQCCCNHTGDEEHEAGENLEETGSDSTAAGTLHHLLIALTGNLTEYTLNDVLVCTPIPETDDGSSNEHHESGILLIHAVACLPVEHVGCSVAVVELVAVVHHACPSLTDAAATKSSQTEEQYKERTDNENRSLDGGESHHTLHTTEYGEDSGKDDKTDSSCPEVEAPKILEEDTTGKCGHAHLCENVSHKCDD